ncbi:tRNA pseudouridine(55) synthase TruB [Catenovulum sediminis]|uniref:tRNA pseudouridine(55) synthase TruB n=1 Tax=Catenovulum sediminis TaxID=1740262 RepID=UPI00117F60C5|nr:tRNA pseudouridine(55) synthase TruB [Catenovulum sediminis]
MNKRVPFRALNGIVLLDKGLDVSSNRALQNVRFLFRAKKAGHTGALDPLATGLLPICFGEATKFSQFLLDADKTYQVTAHLGIRTTTSDSEGEVVSKQPVDCSVAEIESAAFSFLGKQKQQPSIYSALKYQGKPLYHYARKGIDVPRPVREIEVFQIKIEAIELPYVRMTIACSKGTYIRTIVDDLGEKLGCGAHVSALRRTIVAGFDHLPMYTFEQLQNMDESEREAAINPLDAGIQHLPQIRLPAELTKRFVNGQRFEISADKHKIFRVYDEQSGVMLGIAELDERNLLHPKRLLDTTEIR